MAKKATDNVEDIRAKLFNYTEFRSAKEFEVGGIQLQVKQPTIAEWAEISNASSKTRMKDKEDGLEFYTDVAMRSYHILTRLVTTGSGDPVFRASDKEQILRAPVGSFIDQAASKAFELLNEDAATPEDAEKK